MKLYTAKMARAMSLFDAPALHDDVLDLCTVFGTPQQFPACINSGLGALFGIPCGN